MRGMASKVIYVQDAVVGAKTLTRKAPTDMIAAILFLQGLARPKADTYFHEKKRSMEPLPQPLEQQRAYASLATPDSLLFFRFFFLPSPSPASPLPSPDRFFDAV